MEIKIELTDACDMSCNFCHQGFGHNKNTSIMPMTIYSDILDKAKLSGVSSIRITGGEPLLVLDLKERLALAKTMGFFVILNTNALSFDISLLPLLDCIKISLPAPNEELTAQMTGVSGAWEKKLEVACMAAAYGVEVELLTPMFPQAIEYFDEFVALLDDMSFARWLPLRAEPTPLNNRPVSREDVLRLLNKIAAKKLKLYLAVPFCILDSLDEAQAVLDGRKSCGPLSSLAVSPKGEIMRCYSRREALPSQADFRAMARLAAEEDYLALPQVCRVCPAVDICLGGCRCPQALTKEGFDYLAKGRSCAH